MMDKLVRLNMFVTKEVMNKKAYRGSSMEKLMDKKACAIYNSQNEGYRAVRYCDYAQGLKMLQSLARDSTNDPEELADIIESQYDREIDLTVKKIPVILHEADLTAMQASEEGLYIEPFMVTGDDLTVKEAAGRNIYGIIVNGKIVVINEQLSSIPTEISLIRAGYDIGLKNSNRSSVDLGNGHEMVISVGKGDYPEAEITIDGEVSQTVLVTEFHQDEKWNPAEFVTYFYDGSDEVIDTKHQKFSGLLYKEDDVDDEKPVLYDVLVKKHWSDILSDDDTPTGGTAHTDETLGEFIETVEEQEDHLVTLDEVNGWLKDCGICPIIDDGNPVVHVYKDMTDISDSMLLTSGVIIAEAISGDGKYRAYIQTAGDVDLIYDPDGISDKKSDGKSAEEYRSVSDFPEELINLIKKDDQWFEDDRICILNNNWFEIDLYKTDPREGEKPVSDDTIDIENLSPDDLKKVIIDAMDTMISGIND